MSYVLQIWEAPVPKSIDDAAAICSQLHERTTGQNPRFIELARRLTARHPCITRLDGDSERAVWTDGPLDGKTEAPIYGIGILTRHIQRVRPFVVDTARALGLVVFDDQAAQAFLADGTVLGTRFEEPAGPQKHERASLEPARIAEHEPYRLHLMRYMPLSIDDAQNFVQKAARRQRPESYEFRRRWFEVVIHNLNFKFRSAKPLPWSADAPLEPALTGEILTLQIRPDRIGEVRDKVVESAALQGLTVFDPHARHAFWPTGTYAIDGGLYTPWGEQTEYPAERAVALFSKAMTPLLEPHGYKPDRARCNRDALVFERKFEGGQHEFVALVRAMHPAVEFECRIDVGLDSRAEVAEGIAWPRYPSGKPFEVWVRTPLARFVPPGNVLHPLEYDEQRGAVRIYADLHATYAAGRLAALFVERALPRLQACSTVEGLHRAFNCRRLEDGKPTSDSPFYVERFWRTEHLLLAHLAGDPIFDALREAVERQHSQPWGEQAVVPRSHFEAITAVHAAKKETGR